MANSGEIGSVLKYVAAAFPNFSPSPETVPVWVDLLGHLPKEALWAAVRACVTQHGRQFAPSVGEVLGMVAELKARSEGLPSALEAWELVCRARSLEVRRCSEGVRLFDVAAGAGGEDYGRAVEAYSHHRRTCSECSDIQTYGRLPAVVEKVARGLGWPSNFPGDNPSADRAHFFRSYESQILAEREKITRVPSVNAFIERGRPGALSSGESTKNENG